ncbi:MAG: hypothetical protein K2K44_02590 [Oscillospiraceae bacterium]|nr:hypothetical protein [Oscillospiraceae bacterium]
MDIRNAVLKLKRSNGTYYTPVGLIGFKCRKERYTPYSSLDVTAVCNSTDSVSDVREVRLEIGGNAVHSGIIDNMTISESGGLKKIRITSRSFSSMLSQNELEPGLLAGITLNKLMSESMVVPNVTWQSSAESVRYIYVKEHDSQWTAIVNLGLTLNGQYPYIGGTNEVRLTQRSAAVLVPQNVYEVGTSEDYSKMASHYHMKDVNGDYSYNYTDGYAESRGIIRHKYINFDRQFLALADFGLQYKLNFSQRGCRSKFMRYLGWCGEELRSMVKFPDGTVAEASVVEISGNAKKGIFTMTGCYYDRYCNN